MSNNKSWVAVIMLLIALLVACGPTTAEPNEPALPPTAAPYPAAETPASENPAADSGSDAAATAVALLAGQLGVAEADIEVVSVVATEFSDSCLGLGQANESCLQAITPGWLVMLTAGDQLYEVHVDETGQQARLASATAGGAAADPEGATNAAVAALAGQLGVAASEIEVVALEGAEFTDSCLGLGQANEMCAQVMTPGWSLTLSAGGQEYEVHTDATGQQVRVAGQAG